MVEYLGAVVRPLAGYVIEITSMTVFAEVYAETSR